MYITPAYVSRSIRYMHFIISFVTDVRKFGKKNKLTYYESNVIDRKIHMPVSRNKLV